MCDICSTFSYVGVPQYRQFQKYMLTNLTAKSSSLVIPLQFKSAIILRQQTGGLSHANNVQIIGGAHTKT